MNKRAIDPLEHASEIAQANAKGILFTTRADGETDTMVIGWGFIGTFWNKPTFVAYIRTSRNSHRLAQASGEFTINVPVGPLDARILKVAGTQSGRNVDKLDELGLTLVEPSVVAAPAFAECPLTLECRTLYTQLLDTDAIPQEYRETFYPADITDPDEAGRNAYLHVAYYGEIVASYLVEA